MSPSPLAPDLTEEEVARVCFPLKQPAAQARYLQRQGVYVRRRPDGSLLVGRAHFESVLGSAPLQGRKAA